MKTSIERYMKKFHLQTVSKEQRNIDVGQVVALFYGKGWNPGIIKEVSKRKSLVDFLYGKNQWIDNTKLYIVNDKKQSEDILRRFKERENVNTIQNSNH